MMSKEEAVSKNPYLKKGISLRQITVVGLLAAITVVLGMTGWGFIPIPPIHATILHVPTIIGGLLEGPRVGAMVGFIFGAYSMIQNMVSPNVMSFAFLNPLVSVLPRLLLGPVAYMIYKLLPFKSEKLTGVRIAVSAFLATATHTVMVMSAIYFLYGQSYAQSQGIPEAKVAGILIGVGLTHGIPEAALAAVVATPIVLMVRKNLKHK